MVPVFPQEQVWNALLTVLLLIVADTALGIIVAIGNNKFNIREFPRFLQTAILPYVGGLSILALAANNPEIKTLFFASAMVTAAKFLAEIKDKVKEIFGSGVIS